MSERVGACEYCGTFNHTYACFVHQLDATRAALQKAEEALAVSSANLLTVQRYAAQVEEVARELLAALQRFIEWHGAAHTDNCPTDDTCICDGAAYNNAVNAAIQRATTLLGDPPACLDPCAVCGKSLEEHPRCPKCGYSKCDAGMWLDHGRCRCSGTLLASAGESTGEATDSKT